MGLHKIIKLIVILSATSSCSPDCYNNEDYFLLTEEQARKFPNRYSMGEEITFLYSDSMKTDTVIFKDYVVDTYIGEAIDDPPVCEKWLSELIIAEMATSEHKLTLELNAEASGQFYITTDGLQLYLPLDEISSSKENREYEYLNTYYDTIRADVTYNTEWGIERVYWHNQKIEWRRLP